MGKTAAIPQGMSGQKDFAPLICDEASEAMQEHRFSEATEEAWTRARRKHGCFAEYL